MKLYAIKMPDGTYFAQNPNKNDNTFRFTKDIKKAHTYVSVQGIEKALGKLTYIFKGAAIIDLDNMEIIKHIRGYHYTLKNVEIVLDRPKAILIQGGIWLPKSHVEFLADTQDIGISHYKWSDLFFKYTHNGQLDTLDMSILAYNIVV